MAEYVKTVRPLNHALKINLFPEKLIFEEAGIRYCLVNIKHALFICQNPLLAISC